MLTTPVRPLEVMVGKILYYVLISYIQLTVIISAAFVIFDMPMIGSLPLLLALIGIFIMASIAVGFYPFHYRQKSIASDADYFLFLPITDTFIGIHIPISRHASMGTIYS